MQGRKRGIDVMLAQVRVVKLRKVLGRSLIHRPALRDPSRLPCGDADMMNHGRCVAASYSQSDDPSTSILGDVACPGIAAHLPHGRWHSTSNHLCCEVSNQPTSWVSQNDYGRCKSQSSPQANKKLRDTISLDTAIHSSDYKRLP